jgi:hypothetical protein
MNIEALAIEISEYLCSIDITDETFTEYFIQILLDESMERDEQIEIITEFLQDASSTDASEWIAIIIDKYVILKLEFKEQQIQEAIAKQPEVVKKEVVLNTKKTPKEMSKQERQNRERLLAQYGYEVDDVVENEFGESEFVRHEHKETEIINIREINKSAVKEKENIKKTQLKEKHTEDKIRNKLDLERQRLSKELKKKGTQKREKVRG